MRRPMLALAFVAVALTLLPNRLVAQDCTNCGGYSVLVTPSTGAVGKHSNTSSDTVKFAVKNTGTNPDTYTLTCSKTGGITCTSVNPTTLISDAGQLDSVTVVFSVGASGGTVSLTATSTHTSGQGQYAVTCEPAVTLVAPVLTSGSRAVVHNRQPLIRATFLPNGSAIDTTKTRIVWRTDTVTTLARANRGVLEWEVDSTHWLGVGDSALATVKVCALNTLCTTVTRWEVLTNDSTPVLGFQGMPLEGLGRQFGAPLGPGITASGADIETAIGTPAYVSMGSARSAGLVYSTRQSYPRALVPVDLELPWPSGTPDQVKLVLFDGATRLDSLVVSSPSCSSWGGSTKRCRAVLQGDFAGSTFSTPTRKWLTVQAQVTSGSTTKLAADSFEIVLVDRRATLYGSGWWPAGMLKIVGAGSDRLLIGPNGTATVYRGNGDSLYLSPPGDFSTLVKVGSSWELDTRGSTAKLVFDSNGRLQAAVDANGNRDSVAYSGSSDQVTALVDPMAKSIAVGYDGNGKVSTFTDPGSRQTKVSVNNTNNQLTYDSVSSLSTKPYTATFVYQTYPGTNTAVLTKRIGVILDTTIVVYDSTFRRRAIQTSLPLVRDENGNSTKPAVTYTSVLRRGFGSLISLDSAYAEMKDPRNNWSRSLVNRWAESRNGWDSLGVVGKAQYSPDGLAQWAQGKTADSSRVYTAYDNLSRPAKSYIVRSTADTLRVDSAVYDASSRITQQIDARGRASQLAYDASGNVLQSISANNDTTRSWYRANGLVDSIRLPGVTVSRRAVYDVTWNNPSGHYDENGQLLDTAYFDALGRDTASDVKTRVQVTNTAVMWQWRRTEVFYNVAGLVDSTRLIRTDNCAAPCTSKVWPSSLDTDSTHVQRVRYTYDRAGRDSLRINDRKIKTEYVYDRLGRLVRRRPSISSTVADSFVYDVAGNLTKAITRRGDALTTTYDSRNRPTATVVPRLGTLRMTYSGPLDQLTRAWIDNFADSAGGVNPTVAWVYDQRGRQLSDTSFSGTVARPTTYAYDSLERPTTMTDAMGAWSARYETNRGIADTLLSPLGDTVMFTFDHQWRASGPVIHGGGPALSSAPQWDAGGGLNTLTQTVSGVSGYDTWDYYLNDGAHDLGDPVGPYNVVQHGAGTLDTLRDSVAYDGWGRMLNWVERNSNHVMDGYWLQRDTVSFDRVGNVLTSAGAEVYDTLTMQMKAWGSGAGVHSYQYDAAGNLVQDSAGGAKWVYVYDALDHLDSVVYNGTLIARYAYDILGRRVMKRVYSSTTGGVVSYTRFVYHGSAVGFETDSAGSTIGVRYVWGPGADNLIAVQPDTFTAHHYYALHDLIGSVRALVRRDGTWMMSERFMPYGTLISRDTNSAAGVGFVLRYTWTDREYDPETGLYFHRSRYYSAGVRRFVQEDPAGYGGSSNLYEYVDGGVLGARDPSGMVKSAGFYEHAAAEARAFAGAQAAGASFGGDCMIDGVHASALLCEGVASCSFCVDSVQDCSSIDAAAWCGFPTDALLTSIEPGSHFNGFHPKEGSVRVGKPTVVPPQAGSWEKVNCNATQENGLPEINGTYDREANSGTYQVFIDQVASGGWMTYFVAYSSGVELQYRILIPRNGSPYGNTAHLHGGANPAVPPVRHTRSDDQYLIAWEFKYRLANICGR